MLVEAYWQEIREGLDHLSDYERALPWLRTEAQVVDTTGVLPAEVAETVLRGVRTG